MKKLLLILLLLPALTQAQGIITTIAGNGDFLSSGDGGPATAAGINPGLGCAFDKFGNLYFSDNDKVRKVDAAGIITTIAGTDSSGYNGDGIPATAARLNGPCCIAVDDHGNIFINDAGNYRVRKIAVSTGIITTVAGNGTFFSGIIYGGPATATSVFDEGICVDKSGNLYLIHSTVSKVDTSGIITLFTGTSGGHPPPYFSPVTVTEADIWGGNAICADANGNIYLSYDYTPMKTYTTYTGIVKIDASGIASQYAGKMYKGYNGDGGQATSAEIGFVNQLTMDQAGNLYFTDEYSVRRVDPSGMICTVAGNGTIGFSGDGGAATAAQLYCPSGVTVDIFGDIYISDRNRIRKVTQPECGYIHTGVNSPGENGKQFTISPNPAIGFLTITSLENINQVVINNMLGQTLYTHDYNSHEVHVNVADLPKGIYLVRINDSEVRKFVKE